MMSNIQIKENVLATYKHSKYCSGVNTYDVSYEIANNLNYNNT